MDFLNPFGLLWGLCIPGIIISYMLKQQHEEVEISSTYLWDRVIRDMEASRPWQKIRKNLLLFLQLLAASALVLGIARPFWSQGGRGSEKVLIMDLSASMQAVDVAPSRFEKARQEAEELINGMLPGERMTIIAASDQAEIIISRSADKEGLKKRLRALAPGNGKSALEDALAIAQAMKREIKDLHTFIFSDRFKEESLNGFTFVRMNGGGENRAIVNMSYSRQSDQLVVLSTVANYGADAVLSLECLADGKTVDVKEIECKGGERVNIYWNKLPIDASRIEVRLLNKDALAADDQGWLVIESEKENKVLLVTQRNIFLEKALKLRKDISLLKTTAEQARGMKGYSLYIFDGPVADELPTDGSIWLINPEVSVAGMEVGPVLTEPGTLQAAEGYEDGVFFRYMDLSGIHIAKYRSLKGNGSLEPIASIAGNPVMLVGQRDKQRMLVLGFDIHDSDLPLLKEFPIFVQNMLDWSIPSLVDRDIQILSGQRIEIHPLPQAEKITIRTPGGQKLELAPPFPVPTFDQTHETGIYEVEQHIKTASGTEELVHGYFTVHLPVETESNLQIQEEGTQLHGENWGETADQPFLTKELWRLMVIIALVVIMVEWGVYQRGY
ncbi:MAG: vWA domain-containing protein [Clostridia bacterium]|jgi:Ca-activated chloride channel family protein